MKKIILLFLFSINLISAQEINTDSIISKQIEILKENKIEEFFVLEKYCIGCVWISNPNGIECDFGTSHIYIFWKDKNESFYKKIDKCNSQKTKVSDKIFNNYLSKIDVIKKEEIKNYQTENGSNVSINHSTFSKFYFMVNGNLFTKSFDYFDLTSSENNPNINYEYNKSLELIKLNNECDKILINK